MGGTTHLLGQLHFMETVAFSPSLQPMPRMQDRRIALALVHWGPFFAAQAEGQQISWTSFEKHMGTASTFNPSKRAAIAQRLIHQY